MTIVADKKISPKAPVAKASKEQGKTEAATRVSRVKRVKRVAFGMRRFRNYRIRALLYAGRPNWTLLENLTPP